MLCQCPKLTPLQSRFAASVVALAVMALIYWSLSNPHFAYAAELAADGSGMSRRGDDHNWHRIAEHRLAEDGVDAGPQRQDEPATAMLARQAAASSLPGNNVPSNDNIVAESTTIWSFSREALFGEHTPTGPGLPQDVPDDTQATVNHADLRKRVVEFAGDDDAGLEKRQGDESRTIFVSINTCLQPGFVGSGTQSAAPPQLTLYLSTTDSNQSPGPDSDSDAQQVHPLIEGFASATVKASDTWFMSVHAPPLPNDFSGVWNYELAASIDGYFHGAVSASPNLFLIDSDTNSALLTTNNLTQANASQPSYEQWMRLTAPYVVFASNANDTRTMGLNNSFCGLNKNSQLMGRQDDPSGSTTNVQMEMITRGLGQKPKEQFYVTHLNGSSTYHATLALVGNSTASGDGVVGGGGTVWQTVTFPTKSDGNCALLFNLSFCEEVAYAAPSTPDFVANFTNFQNFYDNYTLFYYQQFNYSLQQIPCRTTSNAQFSLAHDCADCAAAYKQWLCAVSIPRCEDWTNASPWLQKRNMAQKFPANESFLAADILQARYVPMPNAPSLEGSIAFDQTHVGSLATNSSRNVQIDEQIAPGPYKEVLPCEDLCYSLVRSCPQALGFGCPFPGRGLEAGYGMRNPTGNGSITCSYMGAYVFANDAGGFAGAVDAMRAAGFGAVMGLGVAFMLL